MARRLLLRFSERDNFGKEAGAMMKMMKRYGAVITAAAFLATLALPFSALAGRGGGGGGGKGSTGGASIGSQHMMQQRSQDRVQTRSTDRVQDRNRDRAHQESGAGAAAATASGDGMKKGNSYGPGDGTGPYLPKDGTGYGAPANR